MNKNWIRTEYFSNSQVQHLRAILNKYWRQHPTRHQLYGHLPPITKTIQLRRTRHARHCWRSRDELISDVLLWTPMAGQKLDDQHEHTFSSYMRIRDVAQKTCQRRWTIGKSGERGSGISVLAARHYYYYYYYYLLIRVFHISVAWWSFTGDWVTASLLKSPGLFSVFWLFSKMLLFGWSPLGFQIFQAL